MLENGLVSNSKIRLGEDLFNEIINHPVPLDMNTLTALKRSALGLDLYLWLVYRIFALRAPLRLTWRQVYRQFGAHPDGVTSLILHPSTPVTEAERGKRNDKPNPKPRIAAAKGRVKPPARLLRCATAPRVTAPLGCGSDSWYGRKVPFGFAPQYE